jgi:hypothetical protein
MGEVSPKISLSRMNGGTVGLESHEIVKPNPFEII